MSFSDSNPEFEALLQYLKHHRGCDLTSYKRSTLIRRFHHRMQSIRINSYKDYLKYLQIHSEEYHLLFNDILINVTSFFRDRDAWEYLATDIIPRILANKQPHESIRVWSAGCAGGQEIYSLLILLAEALGIETCLQQVQCFATDADEDALQQARHGTYSQLEVADIPPDWLAKYFTQSQQHYVFHPTLRRSIVFGHHDLAKNAPMSKIDLLTCRNVLIYFNPNVQAAILVRFHFALKNTGFLFLGKSETLTNRREIFTSVHAKHRIYAKGVELALEDHLSITPRHNQKQAIAPLASHSYIWKTAFETSPVAQIGVNDNGYLVAANNQANLLFGLTLDDRNCLLQNLEVGKLLKHHTTIETLHYNRRAITLNDIEWVTADGKTYFDVLISPVFTAKQQFIGIILTFLDRLEYNQLIHNLEDTHAELERTTELYQAALSELAAANQEIQLLTQSMLNSDSKKD